MGLGLGGHRADLLGRESCGSSGSMLKVFPTLASGFLWQLFRILCLGCRVELRGEQSGSRVPVLKQGGSARCRYGFSIGGLIPEDAVGC